MQGEGCFVCGCALVSSNNLILVFLGMQKIPGYKTPEQEEAERAEKEKREQERQLREEERKRREKRDERESWWMKAKLRFSVGDPDGEDVSGGASHKETEEKDAEKVQFAANRALAAYKERDANDYSMWEKWEPQDPVTREEVAERAAQLEKMRNEEFEANNPDFCNQFKEDIEKRQKTQQEKERIAESKCFVRIMRLSNYCCLRS